jgi:glucose/arabinose dehydrogenase
MRNLALDPAGENLYVAIGSASNIAENGLEEEQGRAAIWEIDLKSGSRRPYAVGMRNPNGMDWNPSTGELWATVQERDMLGPDLVPDYLTNVPVGAHYGWPWIYYKDKYDDRVNLPMEVGLAEYIRRPEYALGPHVSALGMVFARGGNLMGEDFANGAFVARHGSWNRKPPSGYDVIFIPFDERGNPQDAWQPVLTGFLADGGGTTRGRPTWLAWDKAGGLLVSDDTAGIIWRVVAPGAKPSVAPKEVVEEPMPPQRGLDGDLDRKFRGTLGEDYAVEQ